MKKLFTLFLIVALFFIVGYGANLSVETSPSAEEESICTGEWLITDEKPSQFTDETYLQLIDQDCTTEPLTEPSTELSTEPTTTYPELNTEVIHWHSNFRTWTIEEATTTTAGGLDFDREFLAKLLYREAGSLGWTGQVYVCSAILNFCDVEYVSLWKAGHNANMFSVAPYVDSARPEQTQYDVIDYVINGGRIYGVNYFRTQHYHNFGTPVCRVENIYFSH